MAANPANTNESYKYKAGQKQVTENTYSMIILHKVQNSTRFWVYRCFTNLSITVLRENKGIVSRMWHSGYFWGGRWKELGTGSKNILK